MALKYDLDVRLQDLDQIAQDYTDWFAEIVRSVFYVNKVGRESLYSKPARFYVWIEKSQKENLFSYTVIERLKALHDDLIAHADKVLSDADKNKAPPGYEDFDRLATYFEEFISRIRRLEKDSLLENSGIDIATGLRSRDVLATDIAREMDRLARQGKPFALAMLRIDNFEDIAAGSGSQAAERAVRVVADLLRRGMRSFDDAYNLGGGKFVLCLKQTGSDGGVRALRRIRYEMEEEKASYAVNGKTVAISVSSCVSEPLSDEVIGELLKNLEFELDSFSRKEGACLEYFEITPFQRFVQEEENRR